MSYSVTLSNSSFNGGFGLSKVLGPDGQPTPSSCAGGSFVGSTSGTCRWGFSAGGNVQFRLSASGGGQAGSSSCTVDTGVATLPAPGSTPGGCESTGTCVDAAHLIAHDLPEWLSCGVTRRVNVTMENVGTSTWRSPAFSLGAVGDADDLAGPGRVYLPPGVEVRPGGRHTFEVTLTAPADAAYYVTDWRMVHEQVRWFGDVASRNGLALCNCEVRCDGGCALLPLVAASDTRVAVGEVVTFSVAEDGLVAGDSPVDWDFGDGDRCDGCGHDATHYYARPADPVLVTYTATESRCRSRQKSMPAYVTVYDAAVPRGWDEAEIVAFDLPNHLCGGTYDGWVKVRNVGQSTWSAAAGYKLGAVDDSSPFTPFTRVELPPGVSVPPGGEHLFPLTLRPAVSCSGCPTAWRMVRENLHWFGGTAARSVAGCGSAEGYTCSASVRDEYGRPLAGKPVYLTAFRQPEGGDVAAIERQRTGSNGKVDLAISPAGDVRRVECAVSVGEIGAQVRDGSVALVGGPAQYTPPLPRGMPLTLNAVAVPIPVYTESIEGASSDHAALAALYQSGDYDKVVVVPEPFNSDEQRLGERGRDGLWLEAKTFMLQFYTLGYDVWLISTRTGQNVHEQAAEFAQAIQLAASGYPRAHGAAAMFNGRVSVLGISLGGVVSRLATARWQADADWRARLGLQDELPVGLLFFVDSPLRGAQVSWDLQDFIHDPVPVIHQPNDYKFNINSCAFQQLVRSSRLSYLGPEANWTAFFETGTPVVFLAPGVCDGVYKGLCGCEPGPPLLGVNGDGFPHAPYLRIVAYSDGTLDEPNTCYGDSKDLTRDHKNVCPDAPTRPYVPAIGSVGIKAFGDNLPDREIRYFAEDLVPGSRQTAVLAGRVDCGPGWFCFSYEQYASGTFIPTASAFGSLSPHSCTLDECLPNSFNGTHVNPQPWVFQRVAEELAAAAGDVAPGELGPLPDPGAVASSAPAPNSPPVVALGGPYTVAAGAPLTLHADVSDADGVVGTTFWNFGDGSFGSGTTVVHTYAEIGTYAVAFSATDDEGAATTAQTTVSVGTPAVVTLLAPADGAELAEATLAWATLAEAIQYEVVAVGASGAVVLHEKLFPFACGAGVCQLRLPSTLAPGRYRWTARAENKNGAGPAAAGRLFTLVPVNRPPSVAIQASRSTCHPTPSAPCSVTCSATASDPDGDALGYAWTGCASGSGPQATCTVPDLTTRLCTVRVSDGRGGVAEASAPVTGTNTAPSCVANGGGTSTVYDQTWTGNIPLAITDPDDVVSTCSSVASDAPHRISVGTYSRCKLSEFRIRPSCANTPTVANLLVRVTDGWTTSVCAMPVECFAP